MWVPQVQRLSTFKLTPPIAFCNMAVIASDGGPGSRDRESKGSHDGDSGSGQDTPNANRHLGAAPDAPTRTSEMTKGCVAARPVGTGFDRAGSLRDSGGSSRLESLNLRESQCIYMIETRVFPCP